MKSVWLHGIGAFRRGRTTHVEIKSHSHHISSFEGVSHHLVLPIEWKEAGLAITSFMIQIEGDVAGYHESLLHFNHVDMLTERICLMFKTPWRIMCCQ